MPRRNNRQKPNGRRRRRNRRQRGTRNPLRPPGPPTTGGRPVVRDMLTRVPLFPISKMVKGMMYYETNVSLSGTSGVFSSYVFSANDAFDPNHSGTGHQPMGFDQMMSLYEQFTVVRSTIRVMFIPNTSTAVTRVALYLNPSTTTLTTAANVIENGLCRMGLVIGARAPGAQNHKELNLHCDIAKYFGARGMQGLLQNPDFLGTAAASPSEQVYFVLTAWDPFNGTTYNIECDVVLSYDVYFWEPKKESTSLFDADTVKVLLDRRLAGERKHPR